MSWKKCKTADHILTRYNFPISEYLALLKFQAGVCAICQMPPLLSKRLHVDHDHKTKKVRGLLCVSCNLALGHFKDSLLFLQRAIDYLKKPSREAFYDWKYKDLKPYISSPQIEQMP